MTDARPLKIGITCYPTVGGSGIVASALGVELAARGHAVHFISYERPFRLPENSPRIFFHPVGVNDYGLFKYPDYTLPLSVRMAEVSREQGLDVLHVHYAVPHATAAVLARSMLPLGRQPRIVTTLHGTDTTLLGRDENYAAAILYALTHSDAVTAVSDFLRKETTRVLKFRGPMEVVHNFFTPAKPRRAAKEVRRELGVDDATKILLHSSNLRPLKRIDLLLETVARIPATLPCRLVILGGESFGPHVAEVRSLKIEDRVKVIERVRDIEDYLQVADLLLQTSDTESFCLSILEAMCFACPSVARRVGGIPEVVQDGTTGALVSSDNPDRLAQAVVSLLSNPAQRLAMGQAARARARELFSAEVIVPKYEAIYRQVCGRPARS